MPGRTCWPGEAVSILLGSFVVLLLIGTNVDFSMALSSLATMLWLNIPLEIAFQRIVGSLASFSLLAVPFFILAGDIMSGGGITDRLLRLARAVVGWMRGGLAMVNIVASMFFGGISGSPIADMSSLGSVLIPAMDKAGYDRDFATTVTMASSVQGMLVPPSHNMIIYAMAVGGGVSVGALFMAGLVPGILLGIALMIYSWFVSCLSHRKRLFLWGTRFLLGGGALGDDDDRDHPFRGADRCLHGHRKRFRCRSMGRVRFHLRLSLTDIRRALEGAWNHGRASCADHDHHRRRRGIRLGHRFPATAGFPCQ